MEHGATGGSVRKNIALKLRDQGPTAVASPSANEDGVDSVPKEGGISNASAVGVLVSGSGSGEVPPSLDPTKEYENLKWDHTPRLCGRPIKDPLLHVCEICSLPVLIYGRMKRCRHAFCRDCVKKASGVCPKCQEGDQTFEEASMGSVFVCTHGGGRYDNTGCGRSYLSQRDLDAHILYRHNKDKGVLKQTVVAPHLNPPPSQASLAAFSLPPFFQSGILPHRLPPGFGPNLPPPPLGAAVLRPPASILPTNPLGAPRAPPGTLGPPLIPPPFSVPHSGTMNATSAPPGVVWTHPSMFKQ